MADKAARREAMRLYLAELPARLEKQTMQPKYNTRKVGVGGELDQYGFLKNHNVILTCSDNNFDHAQTAGRVFEQHIYAALPRILDGMCHLATDEEITAHHNRGREFQQEQDAMERLNRRGRYRNTTLSVA